MAEQRSVEYLEDTPCIKCSISTEASIHSRRCFMTGEYCSKQTNIHREQQLLHEKSRDRDEGKIINAFVIMNFSDMSDVVYKWRIQPFIESLSKYLYFDENRLYCSSHEVKEGQGISKEQRVKEVRVIRSDSDPASNYVICSRICQQMQIADLVIVDVSSQNANVFYEFGMAVALGKLILPICYSESFYKMQVPERIRDDPKQIRKVEHHIGCYPWRKDLFEYYGIRYKHNDSKTQYEDFKKATNTKYGFSDIKYTLFPYHEVLDDDPRIVGERVYSGLSDGYNNSRYEDNTLVVYTMDAFLNEDQAGRCIVNFYHIVTAQMRQARCFCGERVGVLVQENTVLETEKDAQRRRDLFYSVGEIIQIGLNQATYLAMRERIDAWDLFAEKWKDSLLKERREEIDRFVKGYVRNRGMRVYPKYPVFVDRMKNLLHKDILEPVKAGPDNRNFFCLYHVMLRTLRYTNEVVVDISNNSLQSLFWLGVAHGSDIHAITVMHEKTGSEKKADAETDQETRYVFDVAGLWTAIFRKNDTEGFYRQLALAQHGIERHSRLMLPESGIYQDKLEEYFSAHNRERGVEMLKELEKEKRKDEEEVLESYYRNRFWAPMLRYNQLSIYVSQKDEKDENGEPRISTAKWDFDAISELSNYLSKRKVIGKYRLTALKDGEDRVKEAKDTNFICVGSRAQPLGPKEGPGLPDYINKNKELRESPNIHKWAEKPQDIAGITYTVKGFERISDKDKGFYTHIPQTVYKESYQDGTGSDEMRLIRSLKDVKNSDFALAKRGSHYEVAQLVLWREDAESPDSYSHYWVSVVGGSGPATLALSTILTDEEQRNQILHLDKNKTVNFLSKLQSEVRTQFMDLFVGKLTEKMREIIESNGGTFEDDKIVQYFSLVKYTAAFYLQTVLYRYFFPFLSPGDIERIHNGMYTFVNTMKAARVSPFVPDYQHKADKGGKTVITKGIVENVVEQIPKVLRCALKSFVGLEAFYLVKVVHNLNKTKDTRELQTIEILPRESENPDGDTINGVQIVNCFVKSGIVLRDD